MNRTTPKDRMRLSRIISRGRQPSPAVGVELEQLKRWLLLEQKRSVLDFDVQSWFDWAADEAVSLAWATTYPLLVFPVLLQEKIEQTERKARVQRGIYERS